jgi:hypothetical protein
MLSVIRGRGNLSTMRNAEPGRLEAWVVKNSTWVALAIIATVFAMRLAYAQSCYLNPDEALHFGSARPSGWLDTFKASLMLAHPPLFILVLHAMLFLGRTELILRLPSLVGGTAALWLVFAWIRSSLGEIPALAGLGFMSLSPPGVSASTEVRQYGLLLFFVCGALYATERIFSERSTKWAVIQGLFLLGALLTHYTTVLILASLGIYVVVRALLDRLPLRMLFTIGASQLILATLLAWLYFGHVRGAIPFGAGAAMDYLRHYYYATGRETRFGFVWRAFFGTFSYMLGARSRPLTILFMLVFLVGLVALLVGKTKAPKLMALLLASPFLVGFGAAVVQVFPFAGTRHQTYLLPFVAAGIAAALASLPRRLAVPLLLLGAVISPLWVRRTPPDNNPRVMPKGDMTAAIEYVGRMAPRGSPLFVDSDTREILEYYLARNDKSLDALRSGANVEEPLGGYRVVVSVVSRTPSILQDPKLATPDFAFLPDASLEQVAESARALGVPSGDPLWLISVAWKEPPLASQLPTKADQQVKAFGEITVVRALAQ